VGDEPTRGRKRFGGKRRGENKGDKHFLPQGLKKKMSDAIHTLGGGVGGGKKKRGTRRHGMMKK